MKPAAIILCVALASMGCATERELAAINAKYDRLVAGCIAKNRAEGDTQHSYEWLWNWCYGDTANGRQTELASANNPMLGIQKYMGRGSTNAAFVQITP